MKNINLLFLLTLSIFFINCSDDEINNDKKTNKISYNGEWIGTMFLVDEPYDFNNDGIAGTDYKVELPCLMRNITLNEDGTGLIKSNIHGGPIENITCVEYIENKMTWKVNEDETKILLIFSKNTFEMKIVNENKIEQFSNSLLDDEIGIPGKIVFEKQ